MWVRWLSWRRDGGRGGLVHSRGYTFFDMLFAQSLTRSQLDAADWALIFFFYLPARARRDWVARMWCFVARVLTTGCCEAALAGDGVRDCADAGRFAVGCTAWVEKVVVGGETRVVCR